MFLSKILSNTLCMVILYIVEENIFVVIVYKVFIKNSYQRLLLKLMVNNKL